MTELPPVPQQPLDSWETPNEYDAQFPPIKIKAPRKTASKKQSRLTLSWSRFKMADQCRRWAAFSFYPDEMGVTVPPTGFVQGYPSLKGNMVQTLVEHLYVYNYLALPGPEMVKGVQASWRYALKLHTPLNWITPEQLLQMRQESMAVFSQVLVGINKHEIFRMKTETEKDYFFPLPGTTVNMFGRADMLLYGPQDVWLLDGKVYKNPAYLDDRQLVFYAYLHYKTDGRIPDRASFWLYDRAELLDVPVNLRVFKKLQDEVLSVANDIQAKNFPASPSDNNCKFCDFKPFCSDYQEWYAKKNSESVRITQTLEQNATFIPSQEVLAPNAQVAAINFSEE